MTRTRTGDCYVQFEGPVSPIREEPGHNAVVGTFKEWHVVVADDQATGRKPVGLWIIDAISPGFIYVHTIREPRVLGLTDMRLELVGCIV